MAKDLGKEIENMEEGIENLKNKLRLEIHNTTSQLKGSYFDDMMDGGGDPEKVKSGKKVGKEIDKLLSRKVELLDFNE